MMSTLYLTLLVAAAAVRPYVSSTRPPARSALLRAEMRLLEAGPRGDFASIAATYADDIVVVEDGAVRGKAARLAEVRQRREYSVAISDLTLRQWGEVGVVAGHFSSRAANLPGPRQSAGWFTDVWLDEAGRWRLVSEQVAHDRPQRGGQKP